MSLRGSLALVYWILWENLQQLPPSPWSSIEMVYVSEASLWELVWKESSGLPKSVELGFKIQDQFISMSERHLCDDDDDNN